jgi:hypothetical protein
MSAIALAVALKLIFKDAPFDCARQNSWHAKDGLYLFSFLRPKKADPIVFVLTRGKD